MSRFAANTKKKCKDEAKEEEKEENHFIEFQKKKKKIGGRFEEEEMAGANPGPMFAISLSSHLIFKQETRWTRMRVHTYRIQSL